MKNLTLMILKAINLTIKVYIRLSLALITTIFPNTISAQCDRSTVINNYNNVYLQTNVTTGELAWTGNMATCTPGTISDTALNRSLRRINYFRQLVGLPGNIVYDTAYSRKAQEAALIMLANNMLSHAPPTSWLCYTADGAQAAGSSNLSFGSHSSGAISAYMDETGANNTAAGHRRWILYSSASKFGMGSTSSTSALWVFGPYVNAPTIDFIAYPSEGFFPAPLVPSSHRWSFGIPNADFSSAIVSMTDASGASVPVTLEPLAYYGDNTIVWKPSAINTSGQYDEKYTVQISNVLVNGNSKTYTYDVIICQPVHPPLCPGALIWSESDCACMPLGSVAISGAVVSELGEPVTGVSLWLSGADTQTVVTANDGLYNYVAQSGESYTITPSKSNDSITNNGVTTLDILILRRQILAIAPLNTAYKEIAADVNGSGSVTTADILFIRSMILQITTTFPNGKLWAFVPDDYVFLDPQDPFPYPASRTYNNLTADLTDQDFIGIKLGDVNNDWNPAIAKSGAVGEVQLVMDEQHVLQWQEIVVPAKVRDFKNVLGYQFTMTWNPEVLQLLDVNNKSVIGYFGKQKIGEGFLTTSWDDEMAKGVDLNNDETLFELKFRVIGAEGSFSEIKINSDLTASEAYDENLDLLAIKAGNGMVKVGDAAISHLHAQPNPFSNTTNVVFNLPKDETINIIIYDLLGNQIKKVNAYYTVGEHQLEWDGTNEDGNPLSKGLYHVRVEAEEYTDVLKVILIK